MDYIAKKKINLYASGENFIKETTTLSNQPKRPELDVEGFVRQLKSLTIKSWQVLVAENILWRTHELVSALLEDKVMDACIRMKKERLHRVAVVDKESQLVVGTLTHRDFLIFLIKNFSHEKEEIFGTALEHISDLDIIKNVICVKHTDTVSHSFESLLQYRISSIPVVDNKDRYLGMILKKDIYYVIKDNNFHLFDKSNEYFLKLVQQEKAKRHYAHDLTKCFFKPNDPLRDVIQRLIFSPGNRLLYIDDETKKIKGIITLIDLFDYFVQISEGEPQVKE